ncbi:MAG: 3-phosphoserine/phosphohydroxythreonine transaminase [Myxococcales bacterium]|nr:3-phosphoserine/phosphohydroxythreonine transaminase [Myxococcales bacterium]
MGRIYNFYPGPAALPVSVLEKAKDALFDFRGMGAGIMEISHRSAEFESVLESAQTRLRRLLGLDASTHVLFVQGGARMQFAMLPMNFLKTAAAYINTGNWSEGSIAESARFGETRVVASSEDRHFSYIPKFQKDMLKGDEDYLHITTNNTIYGGQWHEAPDTGDVALVADMSSDIASRPHDYNRYDMIYAGAQKNLGPAGVTVVLIKESFAQKARQDSHIPMMLRYRTYIDKNSLYNTPPVWSIFILDLVLEWLEEEGGLAEIGKRNQQKADVLYRLCDERPEFYRGCVEKADRSLMNVTLRLPSEDLEKKFVSEAKSAGFLGLKGHKLSGGIRISNYNAIPVEGAEKLAAFMEEFARKNA